MMTVFHIHIDAQELSRAFDSYLTETLGFWHGDFAGHPEGVAHFEPKHHLTQKTRSSEEFKALFDKAVAYANSPSAFYGYIEGECVTMDEEIPYLPFNPSIEAPFEFTLEPLPAGTFRETEIHITLSRDKSDPRLLRTLERMGFFGAYLPKATGMVEILTAQGSKEKVLSLLDPLVDYLRKIGGAEGCSVKEERIARWWKSSADCPVPPVIDSIHWRTR